MSRLTRNIAAIALLFASSVFDTDGYAAQVESASSQPSSNELQRELHGLTKNARSAKDFSQIIDRCAAALANAKSDSDQKYIRTLKSWAHNRRCEMRAELAADFNRAGNTANAVAANDQALADAIEAIELDPARWRAFLNRGILLAEAGLFDEALADFAKVCELQPKEPLGWLNRAELLSGHRQYEAAIDCYNRALEIDSGNLSALTGRGLAHCRRQDFDAALKDFDVVLRFRGNDPAALINRGDAHQGLGQWRDAYDDYAQAARIAENGEALARAAWLLATCPDDEFYQPDTSIEMGQKSIQAAGETVANLEALAAARASKGDFEQAVELQQRAIGLCKIPDSELEARLQLYREQVPYSQTHVHAARPQQRTSTPANDSGDR
jgi:tetratricopeptide (TPR) repeat protein